MVRHRLARAARARLFPIPHRDAFSIPFWENWQDEHPKCVRFQTLFLATGIACGGSDDEEGHWVTIDGHPVKIKGPAPDRREETIRLLADTKYGGDRRKAREEYEKYVKDLAFLIKNPILGSNPGADNAKMTKFSDKLTQADLDKAEDDAQKFLASYLRGERADHPGQFRGNGVFSELSELRKMAESGAVMTPAQRTAYDDLNRWADAWYSCYQRAVHGMTKSDQLGGLIGKGAHHELIGALGGFAGVGIGGKSIRPETGENVWARPQEAVPESGVPRGELPNKGTARYHQLVNKLNRIANELAAGSNQGIKGKVNHAEADFLGERFVGEGFSERPGPKGERILISANRLRRYRGPTPKNTSHSKTGTQGNFESKEPGSRKFENNVHLDVQ